jgi:hypothetical protein
MERVKHNSCKEADDDYLLANLHLFDEFIALYWAREKARLVKEEGVDKKDLCADETFRVRVTIAVVCGGLNLSNVRDLEKNGMIVKGKKEMPLESTNFPKSLSRICRLLLAQHLYDKVFSVKDYYAMVKTHLKAALALRLESKKHIDMGLKLGEAKRVRPTKKQKVALGGNGEEEEGQTAVNTQSKCGKGGEGGDKSSSKSNASQRSGKEGSNHGKGGDSGRKSKGSGKKGDSKGALSSSFRPGDDGYGSSSSSSFSSGSEYSDFQGFVKQHNVHKDIFAQLFEMLADSFVIGYNKVYSKGREPMDYTFDFQDEISHPDHILYGTQRIGPRWLDTSIKQLMLKAQPNASEDEGERRKAREGLCKVLESERSFPKCPRCKFVMSLKDAWEDVEESLPYKEGMFGQLQVILWHCANFSCVYEGEIVFEKPFLDAMNKGETSTSEVQECVDVIDLMEASGSVGSSNFSKQDDIDNMEASKDMPKDEKERLKVCTVDNFALTFMKAYSTLDNARPAKEQQRPGFCSPFWKLFGEQLVNSEFTRLFVRLKYQTKGAEDLFDDVFNSKSIFKRCGCGRGKFCNLKILKGRGGDKDMLVWTHCGHENCTWEDVFNPEPSVETILCESLKEVARTSSINRHKNDRLYMHADSTEQQRTTREYLDSQRMMKQRAITGDRAKQPVRGNVRVLGDGIIGGVCPTSYSPRNRKDSIESVGSLPSQPTSPKRKHTELAGKMDKASPSKKGSPQKFSALKLKHEDSQKERIVWDDRNTKKLMMVYRMQLFLRDKGIAEDQACEACGLPGRVESVKEKVKNIKKTLKKADNQEVKNIARMDPGCWNESVFKATPKKVNTLTGRAGNYSLTGVDKLEILDVYNKWNEQGEATFNSEEEQVDTIEATTDKHMELESVREKLSFDGGESIAEKVNASEVQIIELQEKLDIQEQNFINFVHKLEAKYETLVERSDIKDEKIKKQQEQIASLIAKTNKDDEPTRKDSEPKGKGKAPETKKDDEPTRKGDEPRGKGKAPEMTETGAQCHDWASYNMGNYDTDNPIVVMNAENEGAPVRTTRPDTWTQLLDDASSGSTTDNGMKTPPPDKESILMTRFTDSDGNYIVTEEQKAELKRLKTPMWNSDDEESVDGSIGWEAQKEGGSLLPGSGSLQEEEPNSSSRSRGHVEDGGRGLVRTDHAESEDGESLEIEARQRQEPMFPRHLSRFTRR